MLSHQDMEFWITYVPEPWSIILGSRINYLLSPLRWDLWFLCQYPYPLFFSSGFRFSGLPWRSLIHHELIFIHSERQLSSLRFPCVDDLLFPTPLWKAITSSTYVLGIFVVDQKAIDHYVGLFLEPLFYSAGLFVWFCISTTLVLLLRPCNRIWY